MKNFKYSVIPFIKAWEMLIDVELPKSICRSEEDVDHETMLLNFPLVGSFIGFVAYTITAVLGVIPGKPLAPFMSAVIIVLGLELITSGRAMCSLISFIENRLASRTTPESLTLINDDINTTRTSTGTLLLISIFMFRITCFSYLINTSQSFWIIVMITLNYSAQGFLASAHDTRTGQPFFELGPNFVRNIAITTAVLTIIVGISSLPTIALTLGINGFLVFKFKDYCDKNLGGTTAKVIGLAGYATEFITLLIGLTILVKA